MHRCLVSLFLCITVDLLVNLSPANHSAITSDSAENQRERIALIPIVKGNLENSLFLIYAGDGTGRLFVVEHSGRIRILG